uniref:HAT C-terminal dimerisation domain-containing protein n=1 Tax=Glycine max TaxID=3847 RepID=A0A0R0KPL8_SOYBN
MISMMIIEHDLPFSFVEHRRFKELLQYLHPDVKVPSRHVATMNVNNLYESEKKKMKCMLSKVPSRISLTSDVWTSCTSEGYISLTAHYVDANWKLNSKMLNFSHFPPPYSGREMAKVIYDFLEEWGIEQKIFSLTLDNASSNDKMQDYLKEILFLHANGLVSGGEFFHIRCCAHILNLIVQEGLKVAGLAVNKIRESIKYVKGLEGRMQVFKACVAKVGGIHTKMGLRLDVITRWNSTFLMLESALVYRHAFCSLVFDDRSYSSCPTNEEWERGQKMCDFLRPFFQITELISGSSYPMSNLYFMQVWKIECLLLQNLSNEDELIRTMTIHMKTKFDKYWRDYSNVLSFRCILDPHCRIKLLKYCYSKLGLDPISCQAKLKIVEHKLYTLYNEYEFIQFEDEDMSQVGKSQLDTYLEEANLSNKYHPNLDVLQYWKDNQAQFPDLSLLACDILSIQITMVAFESAFSIGSRVLNKYRTRLLVDNVQVLICTKYRLLGFDMQGK